MSVLDELVVLPSPPGMTTMSGVSPLECFDAASEDANGRLPHETGYIDPYHTRSNAMAVANAMTKGRREKILSLLDEGDATTRELEELCGVGRGALRHLLRDLEQEQEIRVLQPGTRTGPAVYSRIVELLEDDEQEAEGVSVADIEELERRAAPAEPSGLRERYIAFLARESPTRLLYLVLEGKIKATEDVLEAIEKVVF